jgi:hypothetical protein
MATYHVTTTGSDSNSCALAQSTSAPKLTITNALTCLVGGDTLVVNAGSYNEGILNNVPSGSSWGAPTRIVAAPGETVWLRPTSGAYVVQFDQAQQYIEFDGINMDATAGITAGGVLIHYSGTSTASHIRFKNAECVGPRNGIPNEVNAAAPFFMCSAAILSSVGNNEFLNLSVHGCGDAGDISMAFYLESPDNLIDGCNIYDCSSVAVQVANPVNGFNVANCIIRNNRIHDMTRTWTTASYGIYLYGCTDTLIYNNLIYNFPVVGSLNAALIVENSALRTLIYHNTITNNAIIGLLLRPGSSATVIENCILFQNTPNDFLDQTGGGDYTSVSNLTGIDPLFVNSPTDLSLQLGSPAIDLGATNALVLTDIVGVPRPQLGGFDIGAYEFTTGSGTPNPLWAASVM